MSRTDKKLQIMKAAEKLFTSRRFHEVTTDDIAKEACVGKGTIYRYFQDKDELFFQIAMVGFDELCDVIRAKVAEAKDFANMLAGVCQEISEFFQARRQALRMMQADAGSAYQENGDFHKRWMAHRRKLVSAVAGIMARGTAERALRGDVAPEVLANFLLGLLRTRARDLDHMDEASRSLQVIADFFMNGASPAASAAKAAIPSAGAAADYTNRSEL